MILPVDEIRLLVFYTSPLSPQKTIPLMILKKGDDIMADEFNPYRGAYTGPQIDEVIGQILTEEYIGRSIAVKERTSEADPLDLNGKTTSGIWFIEFYTNDFHQNEVRPFHPIYLFVSENENTGIVSQRYQAYNEKWYTRFIDPTDPATYEWTLDNDYYKTLADTIIEYSDIEAIPKFTTIEEYQKALDSGEAKDKLCIIEEEESDLDYQIVFPYVGENKNWWILGQDTGMKAIMEPGIDYFTEEDREDIANRVLESDTMKNTFNNIVSLAINEDDDLIVTVEVEDESASESESTESATE